jgi:UDP-glucose 4-epimerase
MILITGGLGFIGSHTVRALLDLGEGCVLIQRRTPELSRVLRGALVSLEQADVTELDSLREVGRRHPITGIIHLAGSMPWPPRPDAPVEQARDALTGYFNILQLAQEWGVTRVAVASTIGVYGGVDSDGPLTEDLPLPMTSAHVIPAFKKIAELLNDHLNTVTDLEIVSLRISGTWGPGGHQPDPFFAGPSLVRAAARGTAPELSGMVQPPRAGDGLDLSYVKDTGRAIALLQQADTLNHRTYNVASGHSTSNAEVIAAIRKLVPDARVDLPDGGAMSPSLDIGRLQHDTGFRPEWDTDRATEDYLRWLRDGNES